MKKPAFVITEIFLSLVLASAVAAVAVLAVDIRSGGKILPASLFGESENSEESSWTEEDIRNTKKEVSQVTESSKEESSKKESSGSETSKQESSGKEQEKTSQLILKAPKDLKEQPKDLSKFITSYGYDFDTLPSDHFIVVDCDENSKAKVYCYQKSTKGIWWNIAGDGKPITEKGFIGEKGYDFNVAPDSKKTPYGIYSIGQGFYIGEKPKTSYPLFEITDKTYWIDDPNSQFYNQRVEGTDQKDWSSADHMITETKSYKYGLVVNFNTNSPADKNMAGSIFMHCGDAPTGGSIVVPESTMKSVLEWLDSESEVYIFIT